jgi:hypothetical protein
MRQPGGVQESAGNSGRGRALVQHRSRALTTFACGCLDGGQQRLDDETERFYTDEHGAYEDFAERHEHVVHGKEEWVRGQVHTNTMESVWSLLKRSIIGSYHHLSARHLPAYLEEMAFRYNNRKNPYLFRDTLLKLIGSENLPYAELIA